MYFPNHYMILEMKHVSIGYAAFQLIIGSKPSFMSLSISLFFSKWFLSISQINVNIVGKNINRK